MRPTGYMCRRKDGKLAQSREFIFDVFGVISGDENHYALEMNPWDEWLNYDILNKSIEVYGQAEVLAHILYEMTFFGFSSKTVKKRAEKERKFL